MQTNSDKRMNSSLKNHPKTSLEGQEEIQTSLMHVNLK